MSHLQLALVAVAAIVLLVLYLHGKWQERQLLQRMRATLHGGVGDALLQAGMAAGADGADRGERPEDVRPGLRPNSAAGSMERGTERGSEHPEPALGGRTEPRWEEVYPPASSSIRSTGSGGAAGWAAGGETDGATGGAADGMTANGAASYAAIAGLAPVEVRAAQLAQELALRAGVAGATGTTGATSRGEPEDVVSEPLRLPAAAHPPGWAEDPMLDLSLELRCARAVDGVAVIDAVAALAAESFPLPVHFVVWDARHEQWVLPDRFGYYTDALASIQLAGRRGTLTADVLTRFLSAVRQVATALQADFDVPDPERLLAQAQELDAVCARFDIRIGLTVFAAGASAWTAPQLRAAALGAEFVAAATAAGWVYADETGAPLLTMTAEPAPSRKVFLELDVPLAASCSDALAALIDRAEALAGILGGHVVDDNGRTVDAVSMAAVQPQLAQMHEEMVRAGIEPGGVRAQRLYRDR